MKDENKEENYEQITFDRSVDFDLYCALVNENEYEVSELITFKNANPNAKCNLGCPLLNYAVVAGNLENVSQLVIRHKADLTAVDESSGNTAVHVCVECKADKKVLQILLSKDVPFWNIKNKYGKTPLDLARESGYRESEEMLNYYKSIIEREIKTESRPSGSRESTYRRSFVRGLFNRESDDHKPLLKDTEEKSVLGGANKKTVASPDKSKPVCNFIERDSNSRRSFIKRIGLSLSGKDPEKESLLGCNLER